MFLSVIIPAYNEERRLPKTLFDVDKYLKNQNYDYEIIVVDDGSKDKTVKITKDLLSKISNLRLIENKKNHGKGYVVRQGLLLAKGEYRLFTDADNSTSINQVENFLPELMNYDIVIGSRAINGATMNPRQPFLRRTLGKIFKVIIQNIVCLRSIEDTQCGFKIFSKKAVDDILPKCKINGWVFDAEILKIGQNRGYAIKEVPVVWKNNKESKVKLTSAIKTVFDLLKIRFNLIFGRYK